MWQFCNDDRSLLKKATRKAPKITEKEFMAKIKKWVIKQKDAFIDDECDEDFYFDFYEDYGIDIEDFSSLSDHDYLVLFANWVASVIDSDILFPSDDVCTFGNEIIGSAESDTNILNGIHILSNGLPILGLTCYEEHDTTIPMFICIYWDGKKFKCYVPRYGNTFNIITKTAFGWELKAHKKNFDKFKSDIVKFGYNRYPTYNDLYSLMYGQNKDVCNLFNSDAMVEDIISKITVY